jgi:hypothetical protein
LLALLGVPPVPFGVVLALAPAIEGTEGGAPAPPALALFGFAPLPAGAMAGDIDVALP